MCVLLTDIRSYSCLVEVTMQIEGEKKSHLRRGWQVASTMMILPMMILASFGITLC